MAKMNLPLAMRCGDCKHWTQKPLEDYKYMYDEEAPVDPTVGVCQLALHVKQACDKNNQPATGFRGSMVVKDASNYYAVLWTKDTHGCLAGVSKHQTHENLQNSAS